MRVVNVTFDISLHVQIVRTGDVRVCAVVITQFLWIKQKFRYNKSRGEKKSRWKTIMPDWRLGNLFQLPRRRISRKWTPSGTNTVIFEEALSAQTNIFWHEIKINKMFTKI